jgi:MYXO-CTERM domain-containing protein
MLGPMRHASFAPRAAAAVSCLALGLLALPSPAAANGRYPASGQIVLSPITPDTLLVRATYGLLYSTNAGQSWGWICEPAVGFNSEEDPMMGFTADGSLLAGIFEGLAVTTDGGCDWSFAVGGLAGRYVIDLSVDKVSPEQAVLMITNNAGDDDAGDEIFVTQLWQTMDNGQTWAQAGVSLDPELLALTVDTAPSDQSRVYISGRLGPPDYPGVIERSDDRGATWQALPIPGSNDTNLPYIGAVDPNNPDIVYVRLDGSPSDTLVVTRDGGMTWQTLYTSMGDLLGFALSPDGSTLAVGGPMDPLQTAPTSTMALTVASMDNVLCLTWDASGLYACADEFLQGFTAGKSTDQGKTWKSIMQLGDLCGPLACAATSSVGEQCPSLWSLTATTIDAYCTGGSGGASASSSSSAATGAGGGSSGGGVTGKSCSCAVPGDERDPLAVALGGLLAAALVARRARRAR